MRKAILVVAVVVCMTGCSSSAYLTDRGRDAADILTLTAGVGFGVRARVGPLHTGLIANYDAAGLRAGDLAVFAGEPKGRRFFDMEFPWPGPFGSWSDEWAFGGVGSFVELCWTEDVPMLRGKVYETGNMTWSRGVGTSESWRWVPLVTSGLRTSESWGGGFHSYWTQVEVSGGLIGTLRVGVNPGELVDFLLGWATLDLYSDDIGIVQIDEE